MEQVVYQEPLIRDEQLARLGLSLEVMQRVALACTRFACTDNDPQGFAGMSAQARGVRTFREELCKGEKPWRKAREYGVEVVINPTGEIAISVSTGDAGTGNAATDVVGTKYPKGDSTLLIVAENFRQLFASPAVPRHAPPRRRLTYMFLIHWSETTIESELSLPLACDEDGRVVVWGPRLVFPAMPIEADGGLLLEDQGEEIEVAIERL